jgi:hypothetical protein
LAGHGFREPGEAGSIPASLTAGERPPLVSRSTTVVRPAVNRTGAGSSPAGTARYGRASRLATAPGSNPGEAKALAGSTPVPSADRHGRAPGAQPAADTGGEGSTPAVRTVERGRRGRDGGTEDRPGSVFRSASRLHTDPVVQRRRRFRDVEESGGSSPPGITPRRPGGGPTQFVV